MKNFIESVIRMGNYVLSEMEERIVKIYILGKISETEMVELLNLAAENANGNKQNLAAENADGNKQIDVATILADRLSGKKG